MHKDALLLLKLDITASPNAGNIKNTEKLNYSKERMYKLTVTAYDCGKNRASEDVLVKINIKPTCKPSWQGIKDPFVFCTQNQQSIVTLA